MVTNLMPVYMNRSNSFIMHAYVCMMIELSILDEAKFNRFGIFLIPVYLYLGVLVMPPYM